MYLNITIFSLGLQATQRGATVILGDKETVNCAQKFEIDMKSVMWGGASEEMLEKKALPGVAMLTDLPKIRVINILLGIMFKYNFHNMGEKEIMFYKRFNFTP